MLMKACSCLPVWFGVSFIPRASAFPAEDAKPLGLFGMGGALNQSSSVDGDLNDALGLDDYRVASV